MIREAGTLEAHIKADTVVALKGGDKQRTQALRLLTAALKKARIDARETPTEAQEIGVLKRERKQRLEAMEIYAKAGRDELAAKEGYEEGLIAGYLPEELSDDEIGGDRRRGDRRTGRQHPQGDGQGDGRGDEEGRRASRRRRDQPDGPCPARRLTRRP